MLVSSLIAARSCFIESRSRNVTVSRSTGSFSPSVSKSTVIPTADGPTFIIENSHVRPQKADNLFCFRDQLRVVLEQREYTAFNRSHPRMKPQYDSRLHFPFFIWRLIFRIRFTDEGQHCAIDPCARFHNMWNKPLLRFFIEIFKRFPAGFLVL